MCNEKFKTYPWYPLYLISNTGRVISLHKWSSRELIPRQAWPISEKNTGYKIFTITDKWKQKHVFLHKAIALLFIPNPNNLTQVNHIDWNKLNNSIENLEWISPSDNQRHAYRTWLKKVNMTNAHLACQVRWIKNKLHKTVLQYDMKWNFINKYYWTREAGRELWLCQSDISRCCRWLAKKVWNFIWKYET